MKRSLFLLVVMGQVFVSLCQLHEYHLIKEEKTWDEAQKFCKEKYTDLATVFNTSDSNRLKSLMKGGKVQSAWIGLRSKQGKENRTWHWSLLDLPGVKFDDLKDHFRTSEPNDHNEKLENCAEISNGKMNDYQCHMKLGFVCVKDTDQVDQRFHVKNGQKNWRQAQKFCREHHTDLIGGFDQLEEFKTELRPERLWIGLFRDTWRWSDRSNFSFRNWESDKFEDGVDKDECAAASAPSGNWSPDDCSQEKPFICYDDKVILVQEKKNWTDALDYCRKHNYDLVTITDSHEQRRVQARAKKATTSHVWLGLRYTCSIDLWFWVSDHLLCYDHWKNSKESDVDDECFHAAAMETGGENKWFKMDESRIFNFVCVRKK